jgi:hypothetical protein
VRTKTARTLLSLICLLALTGCPGGRGDQIHFAETTTVNRVDNNVCFRVQDVNDYQPTIIAINPRNIPVSSEKHFTYMPNLRIAGGQLCIPPFFYHFPDNGQFIVEYVLTSQAKDDKPRKVVVGVEIIDGHVSKLPLTDREITRSQENKQ